MFQFLLGTLKTYREIGEALGLPEFQFLLGTLKTSKSGIKNRMTLSFNSF